MDGYPDRWMAWRGTSIGNIRRATAWWSAWAVHVFFSTQYSCCLTTKTHPWDYCIQSPADPSCIKHTAPTISCTISVGSNSGTAKLVAVIYVKSLISPSSKDVVSVQLSSGLPVLRLQHIHSAQLVLKTMSSFQQHNSASIKHKSKFAS